MATGAAILVDGLKQLGVERIFTLSGNQILSVYDSCIDAKITLTDTRHEAAAAHMAEAWSRLRDQPGVCLVSAGPGHTNAVTAMANALASETPLLWLSGSSDLRQDGRGGFQELDQAGIAGSVCKASMRVTSGDALPGALACAWKTMLSETPGPVHLSVPADLLANETAAAELDLADCQPVIHSVDEDFIRSVVALLDRAERPLIVASPSTSRGPTGAALGRLCRRTGIPCFALESPRGLTDPALHGIGSVAPLADVVLLLAPQDYAFRYAGQRALAPDAKLIQVAPSADQLGRNRRADVEVVADRGTVIKLVSAALITSKQSRAAWLDTIREARHAAEQRFAAASTSDEAPIHPLRLVAEVRSFLSAGSSVSIDGGEFAQWARWGVADTEAEILVNGKFGMIGPAIPFAIAARLARPDAPSVAFVGDGTFGYHAMEFDTALRHNAPFVAIVGNDASWAAERHRQVSLYGADRVVAADLRPTRYDLVVQALGGHGEHVTTVDELRPALNRAFASRLPACVNVMIASIPSPADPV